MPACSKSCSIYSGALLRTASAAALAKQLLDILEGFPRCVGFQNCQSEKKREGADGSKWVPIGTSDCLASIALDFLFVMFILELRRTAWCEGGPRTCPVVSRG